MKLVCCMGGVDSEAGVAVWGGVSNEAGVAVWGGGR